ncbi:MAG: hypothetical protein JWM32_3146 [Verrucomicrobia bacterium]|nr:hypothetical protein [Verrucomicrobiota bacterium]
MKTLLLILCLLAPSLAHGVETFGGAGTGATRNSFPRERDFTTGWINALLSEVDTSPKLIAGDRADARALLVEITLLAAPPGVFGTFVRDRGGAHAEMTVEPDVDQILDSYHLPGTGYLVTLTMTAPTAAAPQPPVIAWTGAPASVASGASYVVSAQAHDPNGNLALVNVWKNGAPFAFAGGGDGTDGASSNPSSDPGPQSITYTAQAFDALGAASALISFTVTIAAAPPVTFNLTTVAGSGGSVSPGGTFPSGASATVSAIADPLHDFAGWSGDAAGMSNPVSVAMTAARTVQANFVPKSFTLATAAGSGGTVTPGGAFPFGSVVPVTATPDATHFFSGWTGDASGAVPSVAVVVDAPKAVQAWFAPKGAQTISFLPPGDHPEGSPPFVVDAASSVGLPLTLSVVSGPANVTGLSVQVTGAGPVVLQASQAGDATTLPAAAVTQAFNVTAAAVVRLQTPPRVFLQSAQTGGSLPFVLQP